MKLRVIIFSVLIMLTFSACSTTGVINLISPSGHYEKISDLPYGDLERQKVDIYIPNPEIRKNILIVFFYGGSWDSGNKDAYKFVASSLTQHGYTVAIPDYRLFPEVIFPEFMQDAAKSVAWLQGNNEQLKNIDQIFLMGHSAGAQIAGLLVSDQSYLQDEGVEVEKLSGCIGLSGPYNFLPLKSNRLKNIFPEAVRDDSQPINFIDGDEVPFLLLHGLTDKTVLPKNSETFAERIRGSNGKVTINLYENVDHVKILKSFVRGFEESVPTIKDMNQFISDIGN